jgi:hypothetical protein
VADFVSRPGISSYQVQCRMLDYGAYGGSTSFSGGPLHDSQ